MEMRKLLIVTLTFVAVMSLTLSACSGKGEAVNVDVLPAEVADKAELESYECNTDAIGEKIYVKDLETNYECDGEDWFESNEKNKPKSSSAMSSSSMQNLDENSVSSEENDSSEQSSSSFNIYVGIPSSSVVSSSSVVMAIPCKTETEDNCEYGSLYDPRDGRTYKTVKIGEQWWMAENLRLDTTYADADLDSCYSKNKLYNCVKYGKFYDWSAHYDLSYYHSNAVWVCPAGWDLPSNRDWETLLAAVGGKENAGKVLKSASGWSDGGNGTDAFGFNALPGGCQDRGVHASPASDLVGTIEKFWSASYEFDRDTYNEYYYPYRLVLEKKSDEASLERGDLAANYEYHVRCICSKACQNEQN